jgi:leucyl/phenylalanyl-tRNA--protein transferase
MSRVSKARTHFGLSDEQLVNALLEAYRCGAFPMGESDSDEVKFYRPDPRGVMPLEPGVFHVPKTIEKLIGQGRFEFRIDTAFVEVVKGCAMPRPECQEDREGTTLPGTWINNTIIAWYELLHRFGHAHSLEAWITAYNERGERESRLVGGIYGVAIGAAFFGESMFHVALPRRADGSRDPFDGTSAGQACLVVLVRRLRDLGFELFDTQMTTNVTRRFGAFEISLDEYLERLEAAVEAGERWRSE